MAVADGWFSGQLPTYLLANDYFFFRVFVLAISDFFITYKLLLFFGEFCTDIVFRLEEFKLVEMFCIVISESFSL